MRMHKQQLQTLRTCRRGTGAPNGRLSRIAVSAIFTATLLATTQTARADATAAELARSASPTEIAQLINDLSDSSYDKRTLATRRLCAIAAPATKALQQAAAGGDIETALRAKGVLATLDRVFFSGVTMSLEFSHAATAWNDPVDLKVTFTNSTKFEARVPFELDAQRRSALTDNARQVGDMLDLADWLTVLTPKDRQVAIHVDDIQTDESVAKAVEQRLNGLPISVLPPESTTSITIAAFNRGWARYRLLDAETYEVRFEYVPDWTDEVLAAARVGRTVAPPQTLKISGSAPATVSRGGAVAALELKRVDGGLSVVLLNQTDQTWYCNTNLGYVAPFAGGQWVYMLGSTMHEVRLPTDSGTKIKQFRAERLQEVQAGQTIELARADLAELHKTLRNAGADLSREGGTIHFSYSNMCDRQWQRRIGATVAKSDVTPEVLRQPLPHRVFTGRMTSNALPFKLDH